MLAEGDALSAMAEDLLVAPYAGKQRVPLGWPTDALHEDAFHEALQRLEPAELRVAKAVSAGWRAACRRALCSPSYQAEHCLYSHTKMLIPIFLYLYSYTALLAELPGGALLIFSCLYSYTALLA